MAPVDGVVRPWRPMDTGTLALANGAALIFIVVAWLKASDEVRVAPQLPWVSWAAVGLLLAGVGNTAWLLVGRRAVGTRRAALLPVSEPDTPAALEPMVESRRDDAPLLATAEMARFHRPGCLLLAGKAAETAPAAAHAALGRRPCQVCLGAEDGR